MATTLTGTARRVLFCLAGDGDPRPRSLTELAAKLKLPTPMVASALRNLSEQRLAVPAGASDVWQVTVDGAQVILDVLAERRQEKPA